jgi:hypothetical protein
MNRRNLLLVGASTPMLNGCFYDRFFSISFEEEVQLHDKRVIVVKRKKIYERLSQGILPYGGTNISRDEEISFDAGGSVGVVTQLFKGFRSLMLDQLDGVWYYVMFGGYYGRSQEIPGQDWGKPVGNFDWHVLNLVGHKWIPISVDKFPQIFQKPNMHVLRGLPDEQVEFNGKKLTLKDKAVLFEKNPLTDRSISEFYRSVPNK